jgi:hypothetical protein
MSGTQQNNTKDKPSTNTLGINFYNSDGFEPSVLSLGYWNDKLSIKMNPALDKSKRTEKNVFDYDQAMMTSLTVDKMQALVNAIEDFIIPALLNGEEKNVSVVINLDSLVTVGTGLSLAGRLAPYIAIHKALNVDTHKPTESIYYEFKSTPVIMDYDASTGESALSMDKFTEFKAFINCLRFAIPSLMNAGTHSMRHSDKYYRDKLIADIGAIGSKLGIESVKKSYSNKDVFGTRGGGFSSTPPQISSGDHSEVIESLDNFMD